jgi:hypothetical protein
MGRSDDPFRKDSARNTRHAPWSASNKRSVYSILARDTAILPTSFAHHPAFPPISPPRRSRLIPHADRTLRLAPTIKSTNIKNLAFPRRQVPRPSLTFWSEGANPSVEEERDFPCERETRVSSAGANRSCAEIEPTILNVGQRVERLVGSTNSATYRRPRQPTLLRTGGSLRSGSHHTDMPTRCCLHSPDATLFLRMAATLFPIVKPVSDHTNGPGRAPRSGTQLAAKTVNRTYSLRREPLAKDMVSDGLEPPTAAYN